MCYKLLERIILHRISPAVDEILNIEQVGFRPGRSLQDQVLALTTYVENGYQRRDNAPWATMLLEWRFRKTKYYYYIIILLKQELSCWT